MSVASPCINLCRMSADTAYCEGCFRTLDEIARWSGYDDTSRERILSAVAQRRAALASGAPVTVGAGVQS
jgi:predicted Fe-S protein YdhL (DUF1289 family)